MIDSTLRRRERGRRETTDTRSNREKRLPIMLIVAPDQTHALTERPTAAAALKTAIVEVLCRVRSHRLQRVLARLVVATWPGFRAA